MMINVVAILAYLIIHINILIFAVGSQIFIELSPTILSPQHTHVPSHSALCGQSSYYTENSIHSFPPSFHSSHFYICMFLTPTGAQEIASFVSPLVHLSFVSA